MEKLVKLFEPGKIGKLEVKNRIIMAPLGGGLNFATKDGSLTDRFLAFYETRARGGVGFIQLTVAALGRPYSTGLVFSPGILSIADDEHIESAQRFTRAIHAHGAKVSFQITHHGTALARALQQSPSLEYPELNRVITATGTKHPVTGFVTYTMTKDEISGVVDAFGQATKRGIAAGFDAVRIQGCHSYLIREFLSPRTNKRTDEYGGTLENRARLACEIIRRVRKEVGPDYPIIFRMNGDEHLAGGITLGEAVQQAELFVEAGVDALDVSSGPRETAHWQFITMYQPAGALVPSAAAIKKATKATVIAVGKIDALEGERILQEGSADFIQMGRALMADAELANKAKEGRLEDIRPCIYCSHCHASRPAGAFSNCTVNMALGKELEYKVEPAAQKKKVMVAGGGPAGMEAARTLAERGHDTSLYEKSDRLGGQWNMVVNHLPEEVSLIRYLSAGLKKAGVKIFLNKEVTRQLVEKSKPDAVVVATGSLSATLDVPGINGRNVVQATDVLMGRVEVGRDVVIIGGRLVGLDTALFLAERGKDVAVVTRSKIARGLLNDTKLAVLEKLINYRVRLYPNAIADSITDQGVNIWWDSGEDRAKEAVFAFLKADTVILAVGAVNDDRLSVELSGHMSEVYPIGDCAGKRSVFAALRGGSEAGRKI